jgi:hypothetical protein
MNAKLIAKTIVSSAIASLVLLSAAAAQAAPTRAELDEVNFVQSLKEAGDTFPAIEDAVKVRNEAIARAEANKGTKPEALAKTKESNSSRNN